MSALTPTVDLYVDLDREQAVAASAIIGRRVRNRHTGRGHVVTDVVRQYRRGAKVVKVLADGRQIHQGERVRVVLDGRLRVSPDAFVRGWEG